MPTFSKSLPDRVRVLVLGGGIHGVGALHDMVSRGWQDIHLVEKNHLAAGTSSASTKLIHGGLRYLKRIRDFSLVMEALRERRRLMDLAPDLVKPIELLFPVLKDGGMNRITIKAGLTLYDRLAGKYGLNPHQLIPKPMVASKCPVAATDKFSHVYSFWDGQTDDYGLVHRIAASAVSMGAGISEHCRAIGLKQTSDGWDVTIQCADGTKKVVSALYVVNCLGPWANRFLEQCSIRPQYHASNNKGTHLLLKDMGLTAGLFLQSPEDQRIFFALPWEGYTLIGTTEEIYSADPDHLVVEDDEVDYLIEHLNRYMTTQISRSDVLRVFTGLRWLVSTPGTNLTDTSRSYAVGEHEGKRGMLLTIYGGKLTTYRELSATIGDRITTHFGEFKASRTENPECWVKAEDMPRSSKTILDRFTTL